MTANNQKKYPWTRYWAPVGTTYLPDQLGFAQLWSGGYERARIGQSLLELENIPCLILLGEPAVGKSTEFDDYQPKLANCIVVKYKLNKWNSDKDLFNAIESRPGFENFLTSDAHLHLHLDGLDEAFLNIKTIHNSIVDWLEINKRKFKIVLDPVEKLGDVAKEETTDGTVIKYGNSFFLRITCRSAIWSAETTANLKDIFGADNVKVLELAPLTQEDTRIMARTEGINENDFVESIHKADAATFTAEPITLNFLLKSFQSGTLLGKNTDKVTLYYEGCLRLCEELNTDYQLHATSTASQRLQLASRIAVYLILTGKQSIWKSIASSGSSDRDLLIDEIANDTFSFDEDTETMTVPKVNDVLNTGLFSGLDEQRQLFKHKTFAEFLAAWHLSRLDISPVFLQQMLTSQFDANMAIPQLNEVATWLGLMNQGAFEIFKRTEPMLLVRSGKVFTSQQTKELVNSILSRSANFEIMDSYEWKKFYSNLAHPMLSGQLKPYIINRRKNVVSRRIAIDMAGECCVRALIPGLLKILQATDEHSYLRKEAIVALGKMLNDEIKTVLTHYALENSAEDKDDELKGSALEVLYPGILSTAEMLKGLTRIKKHNLYASYKGFLDRAAHQIPEHEIEESLQIIAEDDKFFSGSRREDFERLVEKIIDRAWKIELSPAGCQSFAKMIYKRVKKYLPINFPKDSPNRLTVIEWMISFTKDPTNVYSLFGHNSHGLVQKSDWDWLVTKFNNASEFDRTKIVRVLWNILDLSDHKRTIEFFELVYADPEIIPIFSHFVTAIDLDSDDAVKMKRSAQVQAEGVRKPKKPKLEKLDFSPVEKAKDELRSFSSTNLDAWWKFLYFLGITEKDETFFEGHDFEFDITKLAGWDLVSESQASIRLAAKDYVLHYVPKTEWMSSNSCDRTEIGGYRALLFLLKSEPIFLTSLPQSQWISWNKCIIYFTFNTLNELPPDQALLLKVCCNSTEPKSFYQEIEDFLLIRLKSKRDLFDLHKIKGIADESLAKVLLNIFQSTYCEGVNLEFTLDFVFQNSENVAHAFAMKFFKALISGKVSDKNKHKAILASSRLLLYPTGNWSEFWRQLIASEIVRDVFLTAASNFGFGESRHIKLLSADQKGQVLAWLFENFPPAEDPEHDTAYSPSRHDNIVNYRSQVLRSLIDGGTPDSVQALKKIADTLPAMTDFRWWHLTAREVMRKNTWMPPNPSELRSGLKNSVKRFVRSDQELVLVLEESLARLQKKLSGNNPTAFFLWDKSKLSSKRKSKAFTYKDENYLSDFIKMHLDYDLLGRNIIVNREVEIRRSTGRGDGSRTDILIHTINPVNRNDFISAVIEVKGCWHPELDYAMETQLKSKYLSKYRAKAGLYLVGWYYCDHYRAPAKHRDFKGIKRKFERQAKEISTSGIYISSFFLDCRI